MTIEQDHNPNQGPMAGVRVVDLTSMISGPVATMMLAFRQAPSNPKKHIRIGMWHYIGAFTA